MATAVNTPQPEQVLPPPAGTQKRTHAPSVSIRGSAIILSLNQTLATPNTVDVGLLRYYQTMRASRTAG